MKKIILLATIMAFTFAVRADGCGDQAKDKAGCGATKVSAQAEKSGCCSTKVSISTQAEKSGCCATKVSTQADKEGCSMAKDQQAKSSCPFAKDASAKQTTVRTALQSPKAAAN